MLKSMQDRGGERETVMDAVIEKQYKTMCSDLGMEVQPQGEMDRLLNPKPRQAHESVSVIGDRSDGASGYGSQEIIDWRRVS